MFTHHGHYRAGIEASRQKDPERYIAHEVALYREIELVAYLFDCLVERHGVCGWGHVELPVFFD